MGFWNFIKKSLLVILCIILLISFIAMNAFFVLSSSLEYKNIQSAVKPLLKEVIYGVDSTETEKTFEKMKLYCNQNNTDYVISEEGRVISIPCQEILTGTPDTIVNLQIDKFIQSNYYKKYECNFWQCFKSEKTPFFLVSETSKNYFLGKFYLALIISLILIALIFFLVEFKRNALTITGILLIISSLPFAKLSTFAYLFTNKDIINILSMIFAQAYEIFMIALVLGIVLTGIGIGLTIWDSRKTSSKNKKQTK
ncbi:MAG: hypothetical protein Q7R52_05605 [archaeon]|nr:hypothetical protein [archaeon]